MEISNASSELCMKYMVRKKNFLVSFSIESDDFFMNENSYEYIF